MEVISIIITVVGLIIHIVNKANESSGSSTSNNSYSSDFDLTTYELSEGEKLESMNIDNLFICYQSTEIINFSVEKARLTLLNKYIQNDFYINDVIIRKNCIYLKVMHAIPFKDSNKCYGASFSINYMTPNNGVSVYGSKKTNTDEEQVFKKIANELITTIS
jgi:hypothetical protein